MLAAAFSDGVAIYFVPTKRETSTMVRPITVAKLKHMHERVSATWIEVPRFPPCLSIFLSSSTKSFMIYGLLGIPSNGCEDKKQIQFNTICKDEIQISCPLPGADMYMIGIMKTVITCENGNVIVVIPSSQFTTRPTLYTIHPALSMLFQPVASHTLGITSTGFVDDRNSSDHLLHVHSQLNWKPFYSDQEQTSEKSDHFPVLCQWLCRTTVGDKKDSRKKILPKENSDSFPTGGAITEIVCELKCSNDSSQSYLIPKRIVQDTSGDLCAVLFSPLLVSQIDGKTKEIDCDPINFSILKWGNENAQATDILNLEEGRDVIFLNINSQQKFIFLDKDGIYLIEKSMSDPSAQSLGSKIRLYRKGSAYDEKLDSHRMFLLSSNRFLFLVSRKSDARYLLLFGGEVESFVTKDECLIDGKKSKLWLNEGERLVSLIELPSTNTDRINIAISTTSRIMIVSCNSSLNIIASCEHNSICSSLAPIGSNCVSFLAHEENTSTIKYLSYLSNDHITGTITSLPTSHEHYHNLLMALRPDRIVYNSILTRITQQEKCVIRIPSTKPIFLLEPLIANAIGESQLESTENSGNTSRVIDSLFERFGVKMDPNPHNDNEGIGTKGLGVTSLVFKMLHDHGYGDSILKHVKRGKNLMPWIPTVEKMNVNGECEENLHILSDGDDYLSEYLQNADVNKSCVLPKPLDPLSHVLSQYSSKSFHQNKMGNALKAMDLLGSPSSYNDLAAIFLVMQLSPSAKQVETALSKLGYHNVNNPSIPPFDKSLQNILKNAGGEQKKNEAFQSKNMPQLTTSYQRGICQTRRTSNYLIDHSVIHSFEQNSDELRNMAKNDDRKHAWNSGPFDDKEEILLLDSIEEWVGRCRPTILGKEGAEVAAESGQITLQKILAAAAADEGKSAEDSSDGADSQCSSMEGWVENVGEGKSDEEKLTLYLRFFEGADEDSKWKVEGLSDLSSFQNKPILIQPDIFDIEATSSNVDEGESGTVRLLHDLVFNRNVMDEEVAGLFLEVKRGSSLDTGMFHNENNQSRQRSTLEFWFYLPKKSKEIVLARRSVCFQNGEDIESLCCTKEKESMVWELVVLPSGRLEFRSCSGDTMDTSNYVNVEKKGIAVTNDNSDDESVDAGLVSWPRDDGYGGWNHVCLTFCCRGLETNESKVTVAMKGIEVVSSTMKFELPAPGLEHEGSLDVDDALSMSALMFGVGASAGFRITELRAWAYARPLSDVKRMMNEYLDVAKIKKKFRIAIRGKEKLKPGGSILMPPRGNDKPRKLFAPNENDKTRTRRFESVENTKTDPDFFQTEEEKTKNSSAFFQSDEEKTKSESAFFQGDEEKAKNESVFFETDDSFADFDSSFNQSITGPEKLKHNQNNEANAISFESHMQNTFELPKIKEEVKKSDLKEPFTSLESELLSDDVRKSAAAALIRGGPATRHFGGNRGGLLEKS